MTRILGVVRRNLLLPFVILLPGISSASPIGTLDIVGNGLVRVGVNFIDFSPLGGGMGAALVTNGSGAFSILTLGTPGTIVDLSDPPDTPGPPLATPLSTFLTVPTPGPIFVYDLEQIFVGGGVPCTTPPPVGQSCSPTELVPNTPFVLTQKQGAVSVSFTVAGKVVDLRDNSVASYIGNFSANLTQTDLNTVDKILQALGPGGPGYVESSWSAEFTSTELPEPISLVLIGSGLIAMGFFAQRARG